MFRLEVGFCYGHVGRCWGNGDNGCSRRLVSGGKKISEKIRFRASAELHHPIS
jgi:hypothetical protein